MKYLKIISALVVIFLFTQNIYSQCGINSPSISNESCIEDAYYEFDLNFAVSDADLDSFDIFINDIFIKRYNVNQLPIHVINNTFSFLDEDIVKVVDSNNEECYQTTTSFNPCPCSQFDIKYTKLNCTDTSFYIFLDFKYFQTSDSFYIGMPHNPFGEYLYSELPLIIGPFTVQDEPYEDEVNIADSKHFISCFTSFTVSSDACPDCNIDNINLLSYKCDDDYNKTIDITFEHTSTTSENYNVHINGINYGTYNYKNEIIVDSVSFLEEVSINGVEVDCSDNVLLEIIDGDNSDCIAESEFDSLCCETCEIGDIFIRDIQCTSDTTFDFIMDFEYYKNRKDSFVIYLGSKLIGRYNINDLPLTINSTLSDIASIDTVKICMDGQRCCNEKAFEVPDCNYYNCSISDVEYTVVFDTMGKYWVEINNLVYQNTSESFSIAGNGRNYGAFNYGALPITLGVYYCADSLELEYVFIDQEADNCSYVIEPGVINCPTVNTLEQYPLQNWEIYNITNQSKLVIKSNDDVFDNARINVYNVLGNHILAESLPNGINETTVDLSQINTGIYFVTFMNKDVTTVKKIFVNK